jgi:hypothetical protein
LIKLRFNFAQKNSFLVQIANLGQNCWQGQLTISDRTHSSTYYAKKGFPIGVANLRKDNFLGKIIYYFEITKKSGFG